MRFGVIGIDLQGLINEIQGRSPFLLPHIVHVGESSKVQIVGVKVIRALALGAINLSLAQVRLDGPYNAVCDLVLKLENVGEIPVVPVGPDVGSCGRLNQLPCDAHAVTRSAHGALKNVPDAELPSDLLHVRSLTLEHEAGVPSD